MEIPNPFELLQTGLRIGVGASSLGASLLSNPQQLLNQTAAWQSPEQLLKDLASRGENIEKEAQDLVKSFLSGGQTASSNPPYIERSDEQCFLQPYDVKGTHLYGFALEGTIAQLQDLCDRYLNKPAQGAVEYRPVTHYVFLTFGTMDSLSSTQSPDREKGYVLEEEVVFWILTMAGRQVGPVFIAERLAWFMPYVFVNNSPVLISGREVYGISKQLGTFQIPKPPQPPDLFSLKTLLWKQFTPETLAKDELLLEVQRVKQSYYQTNQNFTTPQDLIEEMLLLLFGSKTMIDIPGLGLPLRIFDYVVHTAVPVVFLKQFRDSQDGTRACYQAIIENLMKMYRYHQGKILGFGDLGDQFEITIHNFASHPIVQDLGLKASYLPGGKPVTLSPKLSFWVNFDFTVENGTVIWQSGQ